MSWICGTCDTKATRAKPHVFLQAPNRCWNCREVREVRMVREVREVRGFQIISYIVSSFSSPELKRVSGSWQRKATLFLHEPNRSSNGRLVRQQFLETFQRKSCDKPCKCLQATSSRFRGSRDVLDVVLKYTNAKTVSMCNHDVIGLYKCESNLMKTVLIHALLRCTAFGNP